MTLDIIPEGEERKVEAVSSAGIDGVPMASFTSDQSLYYNLYPQA